MQKQQQRASAPSALKRVTTLGLSKTTLPAVPTLPTLSAPTMPTNMGGMTGRGLGLGSGASGAPGDGSGTGAPTLFSFCGESGSGLVGAFYDSKMDQG